MKQTGILVALAPEAACLSPRLAPARAIQITDAIHMRVCGLGPANAASGARALIEAGADSLIGIGTAGGLDPGLEPGDIVIPPRVITGRGESHATDTAWRDRAIKLLRGRGLNVHGGDLLHSDRVLHSAAEKQACHAETGALAVDMESAALLAEAARHGIPALVIRVVVDRAGMLIPAGILRLGDSYGRVPTLSLLRFTLFNPGALPALLSLGLAFRRARRSLRAISRVLAELTSD